LRRAIIQRLVYIARCAPPSAVGINPMTDWTLADLEEWADATSDLNDKIYPDD